MAKFRNISPDDLNVLSQGGELVGRDGIYDSVDEVVEETEDAYITGDGDNTRAWPKAHWKLTGGPTRKATTAEEN